ncbi:MAG: nucleotidyltransferase domain-containing protein [Chromatiales bacterium]|jgi:predicted nucleotidyltransferase
MPSVSWHSPESVSAFERRLQTSLGAAATAALEAHPELLGIWLFGSRARGSAGARSDVDLLLIARDVAARPLDRPLPYRDLLAGIPAPTDLLVLTPAELAHRQDEPFYRRVLVEAQPLATRIELADLEKEG